MSKKFPFSVRRNRVYSPWKSDDNEYEEEEPLPEREGCCDFEEFLLKNKMFPNYSHNPDDYEQDNCEFENVPLDESFYEEEKEFLSNNEKVYFVFKPDFKPFMSDQMRAALPGIPIFLFLSFVFGFGAVKVLSEKNWMGVILIIPFVIITLLALFQIYWFITAPFLYKKTKFLVTSKGLIWVRGFFRKKCNKLTYRQINTISSSSRSKNTQSISFYTELRPSYKYCITIYGVPKELKLGSKIIAVTKAVFLNQKPVFGCSSAESTTCEKENNSFVDNGSQE